VNHDILERLRIDPGQRTLGQLLQEREAAAQEIARLRSHIDRLRTVDAIQTPDREMRASPAMPAAASKRPAFRPGTLIRLADVCELLGVSRATVYRLRSKEDFPEPLKLGSATIRWRIDAIEAWRDALCR
jgi:predicted DNA-binding transcriptional regulator AlpA